MRFESPKLAGFKLPSLMWCSVVQQGTLNVDELAYWLVLRRCFKIGPRKFSALLQKEKSLSNCFNGTQPRQEFLHWCQDCGIPEFIPDWKGVEKDLAWGLLPDQHILTWQDNHYPAPLKEIAQSPPILFVWGQVDVLQRTQFAVVGSRQPSIYGRKVAFQFGYELAQTGFVVTSGLALGVDGASHEGALAAKGITVGVLGNSLDRIYPHRHKELAQAMIKEGALVSEFPLGTPPKAEHFPQRNRIISGMSQGVLVVEAALKSGSLITANYALEQGRDIFAIPGDIYHPLAKGCHQLIRQGAKCVESLEHILEEFPAFSGKALLAPVTKEELPSDQKQLLMHIESVCTPVDLVVDRTGLTVEEVSSMLLALELMGHIASVPGGYIRIATGGESHERKCH